MNHVTSVLGEPDFENEAEQMPPGVVVAKLVLSLRHNLAVIVETVIAVAVIAVVVIGVIVGEEQKIALEEDAGQVQSEG
jgi:hypothetical protein